MATKECGACGAALEADPLASSWPCEYCKQVNYNEAYIDRYLQSIDLSKVSNYLQIAFSSFDGEDYKKALGYFDRVLEEDHRNLEAWVYAALSLAHSLDLSNFEKNVNKIESLLKQAQNLDPNSEILAVGRDACYRLIDYTLLRAMERHLKEAEKSYFAYESFDKVKAKASANEQCALMFAYGDVALSIPISDANLRCEIASYIIMGFNFYKGACPNGELLSKAQDVIREMEEKNPALYAKYSKFLGAKSGLKMSLGKKILIAVVIAIVIAILGAMLS